MTLVEKEPKKIDENLILKPLTLKEFGILGGGSIFLGSMGVNLILNGHNQIGILLAGAIATICGGEWAIRKFIKPQKK